MTNINSKVELSAQLKVAVAAYNIALVGMQENHSNVKVVRTTNRDGTLLLTIVDNEHTKTKKKKEDVHYENQRRYVVRQS